jgi:hypothetical protein
MSVATQVGYDAISANLHLVPNDGRIRALYVTGSSDIIATAAQLDANPNCLRIDQSPVLTNIDETADYLDYEAGAATLADLAKWAQAAKANFEKAVRPGQRSPAIYASYSNLTPVCNALVSGGVTSGVGLVVAKWGVTQAQATAMVENSGGPFPIVGWQFGDEGTYDVNVFSTPWAENVSKKATVTPAPAPAPKPAMTFSAIPIKVCGVYTDKAGNLYAVGTDSSGELCESKRVSSETADWTPPYKIAGKTTA